MKKGWVLIVALVLAGCGQTEATHDASMAEAQDWCREFAKRVDLSDYVDPRTGRLSQDPSTGEVYYPGTDRVAVTRQEAACIRREGQRAIDAYEGE